MSPDRAKSLFTHLMFHQEFDQYTDWDVVERSGLRNSAKRLITLTYDSEERSFYGMLARSETEDGDFSRDHVLPRRMTDALVAMLTPEQLAECFRKSMAA